MGVVVVTLGVLSCTFPQAAASGALSAVSHSFWNNVGLYIVAMGLGACARWLTLKFQSKRTRSIFENQCSRLLYDFLAIAPLRITVPA